MPASESSVLIRLRDWATFNGGDGGAILTIPGGKDTTGRPVLLINIRTCPGNNNSSDKSNVVDVLQYLFSIFSYETRRRGITIVLDASKCTWKLARNCMRQIDAIVKFEELAQLIVLRPDAFWEKQRRVENCTSTRNDKRTVIPRSRLSKYVDQSQLPPELDGTFIYDHGQWTENRLKLEEYYDEVETTLRNLDEVHKYLLNNRPMRANDVADCNEMIDSSKILVQNGIEKGYELLKKIEQDNRNRKLSSDSSSMSTPQDVLDTIEKLEEYLLKLRKKETDLCDRWRDVAKELADTKDLQSIRSGIVTVTNWILNVADNALNARHKVGYDVASAEELRRDHESLELDCWNTYGQYAELLHKIDAVCKDMLMQQKILMSQKNESMSLQKDLMSQYKDSMTQYKDLISQRDFMDFVCRSFANRLERRRNILITSLRFFRLVSEYFDRTGDVFDSLIMGNKIVAFETAEAKLKQLSESQLFLDTVERELVKEGEKLSDMLSMPMKDALGREVPIDYTEDIVNIKDILDATTARKNIFCDSVELQKVTLEQVTHIDRYEKDVAQAVQWLDDLFRVLLRDHSHIGCTVYEIQAQKEEHQVFQETAKDTYNYGCQLVNASLVLRQSCKLSLEDLESISNRLQSAWQRLQAVCQEQMTRLRVSAVFHRSVEDQCNQLRDLRENIATIPLMEINKKRARVRTYHEIREKLMVEVGRMVRLGKLLRSRLKESLFKIDDDAECVVDSADKSEDAAVERDGIDVVKELKNLTAIEAITEKLTEVTCLAEEVDQALQSAHQDCAISTTSSSASTATTAISVGYINNKAETSPPPPSTTAAMMMMNEEIDGRSRSRADDLLKSDDEFLTASECTVHRSRSSSYNSANETIDSYSQWWDFGKSDEDDDKEDKRSGKRELAKEKMILAVGLPQLPQPDDVLKPSPDVPPGGKIVREVTETTHIKVRHVHDMDVASYVLTSETVKEKDSNSLFDVMSTPSSSDGSGHEGKLSTFGERQLRRLETDDDGSKCVDDKAASSRIERPRCVHVADELDADERDRLRQIKECGDWIQLKILEVTPELASLGATLQEALDLQNAHNEVLRQLQNKQSPVEELLRQADQLISTQRPRAEVYAAMAESLGRAWKDVNVHLDVRKHVLDLNVRYHDRAGDFFVRMTELETSCTDALVPVEREAVKTFLTTIHEQRRGLLESLNGALQTGNTLIAKLRELGADGTFDSRPDRIRSSINRAIAQVQSWMDELHVKRQILEATFLRRKTQLEQCLALAILASDLKQLEDIVQERRLMLSNSNQLGDSSSSAQLLRLEHKKLYPEAQQLQEQALKIAKAHEQLVASGCYAGEPAKEQAYNVLKSTSDYVCDLQQRDELLERAIDFFKAAQNAITELDRIEIQLTTSILPTTSPELAALHQRCVLALDEITSTPLRDGHALLDACDRDSGTEGVKRTVEELENRKIALGGMCVAHKEETRRVNEALDAFNQRQSELYTWLVSIAEAFLQGHQDMGSDRAMAQDFLHLHNQLLDDLQTKGNEINVLLLTLPPLLEHLDDKQRGDVDRKVEALHERWIKLKNILEKRLDLAGLYVKFHTEADVLNAKMDDLDATIRKECGNVSESTAKAVEDAWRQLTPIYQSLKNTGLSFIEEANKVSEPYLDSKRACLCVESVLEKIRGRQLIVDRSWETYRTEIEEKRDVLVQWEENMVESVKTINWVTKLDTQLYPVITTDATNPKDIATHIEKKIETVLPDVRRAQAEVLQRIKTAESLQQRSQQQDEARASEIRGKLNELNRKLTDVARDYQSLLTSLIGYFNYLTDIDRGVEKFNAQIARTSAALPRDLYEFETLSREYDAGKHALLEMFTNAQNTCDNLAIRIRGQEPPVAAAADIEKLQHSLQVRRDHWESQWKRHKDAMESQRKLCLFESDLRQINDTLDDLSSQLTGVKAQYGESLTAAKTTSSTFVSFENTVKLLETTITSFVQLGEKLLQEEHVHSPHIERQMRELLNRWTDIKKQVEHTRKMIDLSVRYFELVNEADEWFKEGSRLLVLIARKATSVKTPAEAQELLDAVETFIKPGEIKQNDRIERIKELATQLYGIDVKHVDKVVVDNREMLDSFDQITNELRTLANNLRLAEEQRERMKREQLEANAKLEAARAEAEAAQAAAMETRKLAEEAHKYLHESVTSAQTIVHEIQREEFKEKSPALEVIEIDSSPKLEAPLFVSPLSDAVIQEGSKFTFMCHVVGVPMPVVTWHKDGISIQDNLDYQTTFDQGLCTLTIEETFAEDTARYTCKAINAAGSADTSAILSVREVEEQLIPPSFVKLLEPGSVKEGEPFEFSCRVEGNPLPTVQWYKNEDCIDNSPDYVITYNNGEAVLKFEQVLKEDKANYTCKANNDLGVAQSTANLSVLPPEATEAPTFVVPLSNVMARTGQKIKLECEVTGVPQPVLIWTHDGKPVKETRELKLTRDGPKATLIVHEAFPKDAGTYVITANNIAGQATSDSNVTVKGRLPTETSDSELASDMEPVKPSIQLPLKNESVLEGNQVRLDCVIVGQPEPEVIWYHDERPVKESADIQLLFQGDRCSLIIQEALGEDAGEYKVVAINSAGEASSKCVLNVTPQEETKTTTSTTTSTTTTTETAAPSATKTAPPADEEKSVPPKFSKLLADVLASEGDKVTLECCVTGEPRPEVKWLLNNEPIAAAGTDHFRTTQDDEGNVRLEIDAVRPEDKGVYTVKASNKSGDAKCFAQVIVKSQRVQEQTKHEEVKAAPQFKESFKDAVVYEGTATKFECIVTGKPAPKVKWLRNDEAVSGKDYLVSTSGDRQVLSIPEAKAENQGRISCVAENEAGKSVCTAQLTVRKALDDVQLPDGSIILQPQQQEIVALPPPAAAGFTMKQELIKQTTSTSSSKTTTAAGQPQTEVHSVTTQDEKSTKQINRDAPQVMESHVIKEYHQVGKEPPVVHEKVLTSVAGGDVVQKSASTGLLKTVTSSEQQQALVQQKPTARFRPPKFTTPVIGKIVDQGVDVVLEGIVDGQPTPQIAWTKNGEEIVPRDQRLRITYDHHRVKLELKSVVTGDSGRYSCTAINEAGTAVSTADVVVRKTIFPPVFGRRLQAQVLKRGDRVAMEVEITGTPEPVVTWHKDGQPLKATPQEGVRIRTQGNCHTMIIERADTHHSGKYMVRAVNSGGEAQSIADIAVFDPTPDTMVEVVKTVVFEDVEKHETLASTKDQQGSSTLQALMPVIRKSPSPVPEPFISTDTKISSSTKVYEPIITRDTQISKITTDDNEISEEITSKTEVSTVVETKVTQESKTIKLERKTPEFLELPYYSSSSMHEEKRDEYKSEILPITYEIRTKSPMTVSEDESGIQTTSISKQSSLDYFVKKMRESEEPPARAKELPQRPEPIRQEIYTKFEDVSRSEKKLEPTRFEQRIEPPKPLPPMPQFTPLPPVEPPSQSFSNRYEKSYSATSSSSSSFHQQQKSSYDGTRIDLKPEPPAEICYTAPKEEVQRQQQQHISSKIKQLESHREISQAEAPRGGVKIFPSPKKAPLVPPPPPKFEPLPKIEPPIALPPKEFATFVEPPSSTVKSESKYESSHYHHESTSSGGAMLMRPQAGPLPGRPLSPRPSADAVEMEKLWLPQKPPEPAGFSSSYTVEKETIEPRAGGVTMEKTWAHKSMESHHKSWPPAAESQQLPPSYSTQSTLERKWTPGFKETTVKESTTMEQQHHQHHQQQQQRIFSQEIKQPPVVTPKPVQHYIAKVSKLEEQQYMTTTSESSKTDVHQEYNKYEESVKPSEIIKSWPPKREEPSFPLPVRPVSVQDITNEVQLEPGTPPEIVYAAEPATKKVQVIDQTQYEKRIDVRTVAPPPPLPPKQQHYVAPPIPVKSYKYVDAPKKVVAPPKKPLEIPSKPFERFPDLEPFPFTPDPSKPRGPKTGPPPTPSKFVKGKFVDSDYESDMESARIPSKWKPFASDTDEPSYRRVQPPRASMHAAPRSRSIDREPLPPSQFERPPQFDGPPRPQIDFRIAKDLRTRETHSQQQQQQQQQQVKRYTHKISKHHEVRREPSPPPLKPGSPPLFMQAEKKPKAESPKAKTKFVQDGYMADTDEPFRLRQQQQQQLQQERRTMMKESRTEHTMFQQQGEHQQQKTFHQRRQHFVAPKKELVTTPIITSVTTESESMIQKEEKHVNLEPFPYKPEPPKPRTVKGPPPPSPSKFVKGEFRESDYESDYEGRMQTVWCKAEEAGYRPVRPVLTPSGRHSQTSRERTPTPPTEFDNPPSFTGPLRPKFEPIDKPKKTIKLDEIVKPIPKQPIYKPKPVQVRPAAPVTEVIVATPALKPGSPPELDFAPGPTKTTYYRSTTSAPYHNAVQTETSNVMHFNEQTEHSKRTVSMQQTTKVIKFGEQKQQQQRTHRSAPPPTKPSKFVPGEFRESDYESEVESTRIKSKWAPGGSDSEEPHFKRVRPPSAGFRPSSTTSTTVPTPMEFDTQPPQMPSSSFRSTTSSEEFMKKSQRYEEKKSAAKRPEIALQPATPPDYGYAAEKISKTTATKMASHYMDDMTKTFKNKTQRFVTDIIGDVKTQSKPILKATDTTDAQVYREESRAAQYGTKHVDPDTGLIYFKYDFGYEFGIVLPGEGKSNAIPVPQKTVIQPPKRTRDIEMPVYHEKTADGGGTTNAAFKPRKLFNQPVNKNVKWEPTSESEMSEYEDGFRRSRQQQLGWEQSSCSPVSLSPSLPSTSPAFNATASHHASQRYSGGKRPNGPF